MKKKVSILSVDDNLTRSTRTLILYDSNIIIEKGDWYWDEITGLGQKISDLKSPPLTRYKVMASVPNLRGTFKINRTFIKEWMKLRQPKIEIEYHYPVVIVDRTRENNEGHCPVCQKNYEWICSPGDFHCDCCKIIDFTDKKELICSLLPVIDFKDVTMQDLADRGFPTPTLPLEDNMKKTNESSIEGRRCDNCFYNDGCITKGTGCCNYSLWEPITEKDIIEDAAEDYMHTNYPNCIQYADWQQGIDDFIAGALFYKEKFKTK